MKDAKKRWIVLTLALLVLISSVSAQEVCEYNGLKTKYSYNYQAPGAKAEYEDEKFIHLVDAKAVNNLEQLKGMICLEYADFYNQGIAGDLDNLKNLINLKVLSLHTNPEVHGDVCAFSNATKLKSLKLAFDDKVYGDISCLKNLNLETFAMTYTKILGDLSDFSHMTNLKAVYLSGTNIAGDVSALGGLINLEELTLSDPETKDAEFYGDLASLDSLKKLKRVALYNLKVINCKHFHETHPGIEGGCSEESKSTVVNTNVESEKIIGKGSGTVFDGNKQQEASDDNPPPEECIENGKFIGESECRALVDKASAGKFPDDKPPLEECIKNGEFIGESECRALVDKASAGKSPDDKPPPEVCIENGNFIGESECRELVSKRSGIETRRSQAETIAKGFLRRLIEWFVSLFR